MIGAHGDHDRREHDGDGDQKISDRKHRLLGVAHGTRACHQLGGTAEERRAAGRDDDPGHLALLDDAPAIGFVAGFLGDRERFAGQGRLIDGRVSARDEPHVGGDDRAQPDLDDIARHEGGRVDRRPRAGAQDRRFGGQPFFQRGQRVGGLEVLPHAECGIEDQQREDDGEVEPVSEHGGNERRGFDHEGDRPHEVARALGEHALVMRGQGIGPVAGEPRRRFSGAQSRGRGHAQLREHVRDRHPFEGGRFSGGGFCRRGG